MLCRLTWWNNTILAMFSGDNDSYVGLHVGAFQMIRANLFRTIVRIIQDVCANHPLLKEGSRWFAQSVCANHPQVNLRSASLLNIELETKASSHEGQCIPAGSSVSPPRRLWITVSIITMRRFPGYFRQILRPIVYALQNFDRNFPNLVAPPTDGSAKCLMRCKAYLVP